MEQATEPIVVRRQVEIAARPETVKGELRYDRGGW